MTKKSKLVLAMASMLGITAGATAVSGFAWFATTKSADIDITNIGVYSKSSALSVVLTQTIKGCADLTGEQASKAGDINLVGASAASTVTDVRNGDGSNQTFTLDQYPNAQPVVKVGDNDAAYEGTVTWTNADGAGKTVTLSTAPSGKISFTYTPYEALTDVSSVDGEHIYKPTWTAAKEGEIATAMDPASTGYVQFTMTITATGTSGLDVFLDRAKIEPAKSGDAADTAAANITRVAILEGTSTKTTDIILQKNTAAPNNKGIDSTFAGTPNCKLTPDAVSNNGWDLKSLTATVDADIFAQLDGSNKSILSQAPDHSTVAEKKASNYVTHMNPGEQKLLTVSIWLEGTSYNDGNTAYGKYASATNPENGMINVQLPLIAF